MMSTPVYIAISYDIYTPEVEAQITRDFLALQSFTNDTLFYCIAPDVRPQAALSALGVRLADQGHASGTYIRYKVGKKYAERPSYVKPKAEVIDRDLYSARDSQSLLTVRENHPGHYLPQLDRPSISSIDTLRMPSTTGTAPPNPALIFLWGP